MNAAGIICAVLYLLQDTSTTTSAIINRDACGPSWDMPTISLQTITPNCYKFVYEPSIALNWYEAVRRCDVEGGELLVVENTNETNWLWDVFLSWKKPAEAALVFAGVHANDADAVGWLINAHGERFNMSGPAWADGNLLQEMEGKFYSQIENNVTTVKWCRNLAFQLIHAIISRWHHQS